MPDPTRDQLAELLQVTYVNYPSDRFGVFDAMADAVLPLLAEAPPSPVEAELRAQNELLWDDLTRTLAERNAVADVAASHVHPGPDGEDYAVRAELVQGWLDEARDQVEQDGTVPSLNEWLVPETKAMRELTRKDLRLRLRRGLKRLRDAKQRTAQVAAQRDHARQALATIQEHLAAEAPQPRVLSADDMAGVVIGDTDAEIARLAPAGERRLLGGSLTQRFHDPRLSAMSRVEMTVYVEPGTWVDVMAAPVHGDTENPGADRA